MKKNRGFSLVELIIVMACLSLITLFFWTVLNSASKDTYTINDKVSVQTSVTSLMNSIQQDVQEARIYSSASIPNGGILEIDNTLELYTFCDITYKFYENKNIVTRTKDGVSEDFNDIISFSLTRTTSGEKYGVNVSITGGKKELSETDRSRYSLNSTYYTRNTI